MLKKIKYGLIGVFLSGLMVASNALNVNNYLGTGSNPDLSMTLSATGVSGWGVGYTIGYKGSDGIPCSSNANNNWSAWNVTDSNSNYYGTITLFTDTACKTVLSKTEYANNTSNGYILNGINIVNGNGVEVNSITCPNNECSGGSGGGSGPFAGTPASTPPANFSLSVSGNQILANGQPIKIKGVVRPSLEWNAQGQYLSPVDMKNMALFAGTSPTNAIRIDMNATYWNNSKPSTVEGSYQQIIDAMVYYATQNNMLVILDYHWFNSTVQQQNMAPKDPGTIAFWTSVANKYKNYGNVIFELYNEPYSISYDTWLNGNSQWYGMQDLYNAVRATGAKNLVIANGLDYGYYIGFLGQGYDYCNHNTIECLVKDSSQSNGFAYNIIYGTHPYNNKGSLGYTYYPTGGGFPMPADFASNFAGLQNTLLPYPIIATEFGDNQASDYPPNSNNYSNVNTAILNAVAQYRLNYTGFAWWIDPNDPAFPALICGDWSNPTACFGGSYVRNDMINNPATQLNFGGNAKAAKAKR